METSLTFDRCDQQHCPEWRSSDKSGDSTSCLKQVAVFDLKCLFLEVGEDLFAALMMVSVLRSRETPRRVNPEMTVDPMRKIETFDEQLMQVLVGNHFCCLQVVAAQRLL